MDRVAWFRRAALGSCRCGHGRRRIPAGRRAARRSRIVGRRPAPAAKPRGARHCVIPPTMPASICRCAAPRASSPPASRSRSSRSARPRPPAPAQARRTMSYPSRLAAELAREFVDHDITVLNRGVNGDTATDMLARFERGVIAEKPDLVLWQVGTNSLLRGDPIAAAPLAAARRHRAAEGDRRRRRADRSAIRAAGDRQAERRGHGRAARADRAVRDRRPVPPVRADAPLAKVERMPFEAFLSPDELHMNDWSYGCVAARSAARSRKRRPARCCRPPRRRPKR